MMELSLQEGSGNSVIVSSEGVTAAIPNIDNVNVSESSRVHIGPKFISVTQNVRNVEVVKGRCLGLELVSTKHPGKLSCSVAVFVCWSILVASGLIVYIIHVALPKPTRIDVDLQEEWYLRREDWQAMPAYSVSFLPLPIPYVIIGHSAANYCTQRYKCIEQMLVIQQDHLRRGWGDIGPSFLVGGGGYVFEGRGANTFSAMVTTYNAKSVTIMFMGNYVNETPDILQMDHVNLLLKTLVRQGILRSDYVLYGQCQVQPLTVGPGPNIMKSLGNFTHWNRANISGCLS